MLYNKMACVENIPPANADSEMEEGEIVDEFDDISSDEELLLRQRLHILETYNNVLEKKKSKNSTPPGKKQKYDSLLRDLSEISDFEDGHMYKNVNEKYHKSQKHRRRNDLVSLKITAKIKDKKKVHRKSKLQIKVNSESSEESDDEYRNKRRKLADAVSVHKEKNDTTSLSARLKMLCGPKTVIPPKDKIEEVKLSEIERDALPIVFNSPIGSPISDENSSHSNVLNADVIQDIDKPKPNDCEFIDLCDDDTVENNSDSNKQGHDVDSVIKDADCDRKINLDSDEDLELLRKNALETKTSKAKIQEKEVQANDVETENKNLMLPEDDDNYMAELRLICLKSAYLKKAFEIKRRQKLKKRLSQSSILPDDFILEHDVLSNKLDSQNNTDIESVDMEIGSDGDEKLKEFGNECTVNNGIIEDVTMNLVNNNICMEKFNDDELEEDEDLLRAKLLTSLSKNLPNLMDTSILDGIEDESTTNIAENVTKTQQNEISKQSTNVEPKKFIIQLGESDSEGEHEATMNLTKMHMKQQQTDFEQQLDMFLKNTRKKVETQEIPNLLDPTVKASEKFVPKSVKHLPKSEQIEYRNLVKRMTELEKMKLARQSTVNLVNRVVQIKETLKPRNVTVDSKMTMNSITDEQIAVSRKKIAEESANMIRLKEEATKLSQKYKIVATELKNIATAIALNKKQQKTAQMRLSKVRSQHQMLLKSSTFTHSQSNGFLPSINKTSNKIVTMTKLQKENNPKKEEYLNTQILKSVKVSVVNDLNDTVPNPRLTIQLDVTNNKKVIKVPNSPKKDNHVDIVNPELEKREIHVTHETDAADSGQADLEKGGGERRHSHEEKDVFDKNDTSNRMDKLRINEVDDYKSPLQALETANWEEDPNAVLCPFEVGGHCKDPDCKYLHPKPPSAQ